MTLHYDPETDRLSIESSDAPGAQTREIVEGLVGDLDPGLRCAPSGLGLLRGLGKLSPCFEPHRRNEA